MIVKNLNAMLYESQGRYAEAEPLCRRSLDIKEKALGPEHPHTVTVLENYVRLLREISRENDADDIEARGRA